MKADYHDQLRSDFFNGLLLKGTPNSSQETCTGQKTATSSALTDLNEQLRKATYDYRSNVRVLQEILLRFSGEGFELPEPEVPIQESGPTSHIMVLNEYIGLLEATNIGLTNFLRILEKFV